MSTGYGWECIRQVCATLLGACHVPERLWGGSVYTWGAIQVFDLYLLPLPFFIKRGCGNSCFCCLVVPCKMASGKQYCLFLLVQESIFWFLQDKWFNADCTIMWILFVTSWTAVLFSDFFTALLLSTQLIGWQECYLTCSVKTSWYEANPAIS